MTPAEAIKALRTTNTFNIQANKLEIADLIEAQAEQFRQMREALEELNAAFCAVCSGHGPGTFALYLKETTLVREALALPSAASPSRPEGDRRSWTIEKRNLK